MQTSFWLDRPGLFELHVRIREVVEEGCAVPEQQRSDVELELVQGLAARYC